MANPVEDYLRVVGPKLNWVFQRPPKANDEPGIIKWAKELILIMGRKGNLKNWYFGTSNPNFSKPFRFLIFYRPRLARKAVADSPEFKSINDKRANVYWILLGIFSEKERSMLQEIAPLYLKHLAGKSGELPFRIGQRLASLV